MDALDHSPSRPPMSPTLPLHARHDAWAKPVPGSDRGSRHALFLCGDDTAGDFAHPTVLWALRDRAGRSRSTIQFRIGRKADGNSSLPARRRDLRRNRPRAAADRGGTIGGMPVRLTPYSITLSARSTSPAWTSWPIAFAAARLMTSSNLVGCSIGMSAGLVPRRTLATMRAR
jgi:hypothetical protein